MGDIARKCTSFLSACRPPTKLLFVYLLDVLPDTYTQTVSAFNHVRTDVIETVMETVNAALRQKYPTTMA
jgi:hypothetical protein